MADSPNYIFHRQQMQWLLENGRFSDVTLVVGPPNQVREQKEFKVYRGLLSAFSPVFKTMFSPEETLEALQERVLIEDVSASAMHHLLKYIYSGVVPDFNEQIESLLEFFAVIDKYQVDSLRDECELQLAHLVTVDSVCTILQAADLHNSPALKERCLNFIASKSYLVISRKENSAWQQFEKTARPELIKEILYRTAAKFAPPDDGLVFEENVAENEDGEWITANKKGKKHTLKCKYCSRRLKYS